MQHDLRAKERRFEVGESVLAENFRGPPKWLKATITEQTGPVSFRVMLESGEIWRRQVDQIIRFHEKVEKSRNVMPSGNAVMPEPVEISHATPEIASAANEANVANSKPQEEVSLPSAAIPGLLEPPADQLPPSFVQPPYPKRERKPPVRLGYDE